MCGACGCVAASVVLYRPSLPVPNAASPPRAAAVFRETLAPRAAHGVQNSYLSGKLRKDYARPGLGALGI